MTMVSSSKTWCSYHRPPRRCGRRMRSTADQRSARPTAFADIGMLTWEQTLRRLPPIWHHPSNCATRGCNEAWLTEQDQDTHIATCRCRHHAVLRHTGNREDRARRTKPALDPLDLSLFKLVDRKRKYMSKIKK
jgi:hypothetical protein